MEYISQVSREQLLLLLTSEQIEELKQARFIDPISNDASHLGKLSINQTSTSYGITSRMKETLYSLAESKEIPSSKRDIYWIALYLFDKGSYSKAAYRAFISLCKKGNILRAKELLIELRTGEILTEHTEELFDNRLYMTALDIVSPYDPSSWVKEEINGFKAGQQEMYASGQGLSIIKPFNNRDDLSSLPQLKDETLLLGGLAEEFIVYGNIQVANTLLQGIEYMYSRVNKGREEKLPTPYFALRLVVKLAAANSCKAKGNAVRNALLTHLTDNNQWEDLYRLFSIHGISSFLSLNYKEDQMSFFRILLAVITHQSNVEYNGVAQDYEKYYCQQSCISSLRTNVNIAGLFGAIQNTPGIENAFIYILLKKACEILYPEEFLPNPENKVQHFSSVVNK